MFIGKITNQLTGGSRLQNSLTRVGVSTVSVTGPGTQGKDLEDLAIVNRTLHNARIAVQIDPTTFACLAALVIVANSNTKIVGDDDVPDEIVKYIQDKWSEWDGDALVDEMFWKSMLDGQAFIQKYKDEAGKTIDEVFFLGYDEEAYDFIKLTNQTTGELLGYKQQAAIIEIPDNWKEMDFNALANLRPTKQDFNFEPEEVINPIFLEKDGEGESLVYRVLDFVYIKKSLENKMIPTVKRSGSVLGVEVGNEKIDFGDNGSDPRINPDMYQFSLKKTIEDTADSFSDHDGKDTIAYPYGIKPEMFGNGTLIDIPSYLEYLKGEIMIALLTPKSRFGSETNRAATEAQLGNEGQDTIMGYLRKFARRYIEKGLFNDELESQGGEKAKYVNKVHLSFDETNVTTEQTLIQIAQVIAQIVPNVPVSILLNTYAKRFASELQKQGINLDDLKEAQQAENPGNPGGSQDPTKDPTADPNKSPTSVPHETTFLNGIRKVLNEEGLVIEN